MQTLSNKKHPGDDVLLHYVNRSDSDESAMVALHLRECARCNQRLGDVLALADVVAAAERADGDEHLNRQQVASYISLSLADPQRTSWQEHVRNCPSCMRAVLAARAERAQLVTSDVQVSASPASVELSGARQFVSMSEKRDWWQRTLPVWAWLPTSLAAAVVFAWTLNLLTRNGEQPIVVASFQDEAVVTYSSNQLNGSLGFFAGADRETKNFGGLSMRFERDGAASLMWPAVDDAKSYTVKIIEHVDGADRTIFAATTSSASSVARGLSLQSGKHYRWELSGETANARQFHAAGGFALMRQGE